MYKQDLALNNLQGLICHKTKPNLTRSLIRPISRYFKGIAAMLSTLKYTRISTLPQHIPIHYL